MKFLSKLGQVLLKGTAILIGLNPFVPEKYKDEISAVSQKLDQLYQVILQAEIFGQALSLSGDQKRIAAAKGVAQVILTSSILVDRKITNPLLFQQGVENLSGALADIMNSLEDKVKEENKT